jgi:hypothetical protein
MEKYELGHITAYSYPSGDITYDHFCALFYVTNATDI